MSVDEQIVFGRNILHRLLCFPAFHHYFALFCEINLLKIVALSFIIN